MVSNESSEQLKRAEPGIGITIGGKPYRPIKFRPRDLKRCDCEYCFGVCDLEFDIDIDFVNSPGSGGTNDDGFTPMVITEVPGSSNVNKRRIYFLYNLPNFENKFHIDEVLTLSKGQEKFEFLKGSYDTVFKKGQVKFESEKNSIFTKDYVAYVDVDVKQL